MKKANKKVDKVTRRADKVVLAIIRPNTGDLTKGYNFGLQTKHHLTLIGEIQLSRKVAGLKQQKASAIEKIAVDTLDYGEVLAVGYKFCTENHYIPCKQIALYGEGACKMVKVRDQYRAKMTELRKALNEVKTAILIQATKPTTRAHLTKLKELARASAERQKAVDAFQPAYDKAMKEYRKSVNDAIAVIHAMTELRTA